MRAAILMTLLISGTAQAHRDYEIPRTEFKLLGPNGESLKIVRHYTDGIVCGDPVKVIIYDGKGEIVAATDYYRDLVVEQPSGDRLRIYGIDRFAFWNEWIWVDGKLEQSDSPAIAHSLWASLKNHWFGYGIWMVLCLIAVFIYRRRMNGKTSGCLASLAWVWLFGTIMYGGLSLLIMFGLTCVGAPPIIWACRSNRRALAGSELSDNQAES